MAEYIALVGAVSEGELTLDPAFVVSVAAGSQTGPSYRSPYLMGRLCPRPSVRGYETDPARALMVELVGQGGEVLLRQVVALMPFCLDAHGLSTDLFFAVRIPWQENVTSLKFYYEGETIRHVEVGQVRPKAVLTWKPQDGTAHGFQIVTWESETADGAVLYYILQYSNGADSWRALSRAMTETEYEVDFDVLPGGDQCRLRLLVSDGINCAHTESESFAVRVKPCFAIILHPQNGHVIQGGGRLELHGQGLYIEEDETEVNELKWSSSLDGELGRGALIIADQLSRGTHRITLIAGREGRIGRSDISVGVGVERDK
jgi:hypothetical protein